MEGVRTGAERGITGLIKSPIPFEIDCPGIDVDSVIGEISVIISFSILDIEIAEGRHDHAA